MIPVLTYDLSTHIQADVTTAHTAWASIRPTEVVAKAPDASLFFAGAAYGLIFGIVLVLLKTKGDT